VGHLLETRTLDRLGLVVVDEMHMIGTERRGAVLEEMLAKLVNSTQSIGRINGSGSGRSSNVARDDSLSGNYGNLQQQQLGIVGMSATVGNLEELATFVHAETYTGSFRPVMRFVIRGVD
jgi:POLQ-like helicase